MSKAAVINSVSQTFARFMKAPFRTAEPSGMAPGDKFADPVGAFEPIEVLCRPISAFYTGASI
jgi:hypothetical protein